MNAPPSERMTNDRPKGPDGSLWVGAMAFLACFGVYVFTLSPTVCPGDSGELIASAVCLGNAHNPGYPLYALLGKVFSFIPFGSVAYRVNLMSAVFGALTVWVVYATIRNMSGNVIPALAASLLLAFSNTFWSQATSAEVYTLHTFFVVSIIWLLFRWAERNSPATMFMFAFVVGLSFSNHMQTVMLAPAALTFVVWLNPGLLTKTRNLILLAFFFTLGLSIYIYLPIRTQAGSPISWGNPGTFDHFIDLVTAKDHRHAYALTDSWSTYGPRILETLKDVLDQYHIFLIFAVIGWVKQIHTRYRVFWALVILFDVIYTVFLNTVPLKVTAFQLPTMIALTILIGQGINYIYKGRHFKNSFSPWRHPSYGAAIMCLPLITLGANLYERDQSNNYTAYEHAVNITRSVPLGGTLITGQDNNFFPLCYLYLAEAARPDLTLYDRHNLVFKMPYLFEDESFSGRWEDLRNIVERKLIYTRPRVYLASFEERGFSAEGCKLIPNGVTYRAVPTKAHSQSLRNHTSPWPYYMEESVNGSFCRDYFTRSLTGYFFLKMGRDLIFMDKHGAGKKILQKASVVAHDDPCVQTELGIFYTNCGMYDEALRALQTASQWSRDISELYNAWGFFYSKQGQLFKAIEAFRQAVEAAPESYNTYKNLGLIYLEVGQHVEAKLAFQKALSLNPKQTKLEDFIRSKGL